MPQTKKQEIVYTVMMVCVMVYGMVCYNGRDAEFHLRRCPQ